MQLGKYSSQAPKGVKSNIKWRYAMYERTAADKGLQALELAKCAEDPLYYINAYVWQYNPEAMGSEIGPFITFPFQDEAFEKIYWCIANGRDLVIEKSRKMGGSWMSLIAMDMLYQFQENKQFLMISRSAEAVDSRSPNSLFWKIDFMHRHLPKWMQPDEERTRMHFVHNQNGSTIDGEASTGRAGVGGRALAMFIDESAQIKEMYDVWHRTSDTSPCRIVNSTHTGINNCFAELCGRKAGKTEINTGAILKLRMHWSEHPWYVAGMYQSDEAGKLEVLDKGYEFPEGYQFITDGKLRSVWYDIQCERKGSSRAVAMDLDIDPQGSMSQFFEPVKVRNLKVWCQDPYWEGDIRYDWDTGEPVGLEQRVGGPLQIWCHLPRDQKPAFGKYTMGGDLSAGTGTTNSVLAVIDAVRGEKVAEYSTAHKDPKDFAVIACALGWLFCNEHGTGAFFAWDMTGPGVPFSVKLMELGYTNVYYRTNAMEAFGRPDNKKPGFYMSPNSKRVLLEEYKDALYKRRLHEKSQSTLAECLAFRYNDAGNVEHANELGGDDPSKARVNHADRVIASALAWLGAKDSCEFLPQRVREEPLPVSSMGYRRNKYQQEQAGKEPEWDDLDS